MTRRSRKAKAIDKVTGLSLTAVGVVVLVLLGGLAWWVSKTRVPVGPDLCPRSGPRAIHLIAIDRSDPITGQQAQRIRQTLEGIKLNTAPATRFDVYTFEGDSEEVLRPLLSICAPPRPEDANELIENPDRVRKRYEEGFEQVLSEAIDGLLHASTRPTSPIMESIRAAAQTSFGVYESGQVPLRATLISDMVQNSAALSHIRSIPNFDQLAQSQQWVSLRPDLRGADVDILYLFRPQAVRSGAPIQNRGHQFFWEQYVTAGGGRLRSIQPY